MSRIVQILIAESPASEMKPRSEARALPGRGLEGDRYFTGTGTFSPPSQKPDFEVTFIEQENIEAFARETGLPFTALRARRNIVTEGVRLNDLVGREFSAGEVRIRGIRLCEPCNYLAKISFPATLQGLVHKGGLRAQILSEGWIRVGDVIRINDSPAWHQEELMATQQRVASGKEQAVDWEAAKRELRKRLVENPGSNR